MRINDIFLLLLIFFLLACNSITGETKEDSPSAANPETKAPQTVRDIEPNLSKADSLQILYYDNPDGDSLRYTRFFKLAETTDTSQINTLLNELNQVHVQEPKVRPCRSEGKLFLLKGEDVLKTIYFSTRGDSCRYFYFIKEGTFIYFPLTEKAMRLLQQSKGMARKP